MTKSMETLLKTEEKPEVDKITALVKGMDEEKQDKMLIFMQGVKFAENLHAVDR